MSQEDGDGVVHVTAGRSPRTGRITALCGHTAEAGEYHAVYIAAPFRPKCRECQRLKHSNR